MNVEKKKVGLIVAVEANGGIGFKGGMPWYNSSELKHFRTATEDRVLIMGSRTADSLINRIRVFEDKVYSPEENIVLKGRKIIVVSSKDYIRPYVQLGLYVERSLEAAIAKASEIDPDLTKNVLIAGGQQLYKEALDKNLVDSMMISFLVDNYPCDTFFPDFDRTLWESHLWDNQSTFTVELYVKRKTQNEPALYSS